MKITPGTPYVPGVPAIPYRDEYYRYYTKKVLRVGGNPQPIDIDISEPGPPPVTPPAPPPGGTGSSGTLLPGQRITKITWALIYHYFPSVRPFIDAIDENYDRDYDTYPEGSWQRNKFQADWDAYKAKMVSIIQPEIDTGYLGRPLVIPLSHTFGTVGTAYIATWDEGEGVWLFVFTGIDSNVRPWMKVIKAE